MLSMTGFGRASVSAGGARYAVEIRSLNHRGLDIKIRMVDGDAACEVEITRAVRTAVERGSVTVAVREERSSSSSAVDEARIRQTFAALDRIRREAGLPEPVDLATVAAFITRSEPATTGLHGEALWQALEPAVTSALAELRATRAREGAAIGTDLRARAARVRQIASSLSGKTAATPERFAQRLQTRVAALSGTPGLDEARLAQEVALLAERLDVTEELVRLDAHLAHLETLFGTDGPVGRKLDFVIQEIGRELNTIASKSQDATVAADVIEAKADLEKLREQAQNIE